MFITLVVFMVTWTCAYAHNQIVHVNYVQLFVCQLYIKKAGAWGMGSHMNNN